MSDAVKKRHASGEVFGFQKGQGYWTGKKRSPETIEKIRIRKRGVYCGSRHWNWKGGITKAREALRKLYEYKEWVKSVFVRDDYTCKSCARRGGDLEADHFPKPFAQILDENKISNAEQARSCAELWDLKNGRTLCAPCHIKTFKGVPKNLWKKTTEARSSAP